MHQNESPQIQRLGSNAQTRNCCFLSMNSLAGYVSDDELAVEPLRELGWNVETVSWKATDVDWERFDAVVIRTTWDYQKEPEAFLRVLRDISASGARLENSLQIVEWNLRKTYLRELAAKGVKIVPTIFAKHAIDKKKIAEWLDAFGTDELVIKPVVSATAEHTYRVREFFPALEHVFKDRPFLVQPFMKNVESEGEFSLFFFGGNYSHSILKTPKHNDFRVQEEHGGVISAVKPFSGLLKNAKEVLELIEPLPLYARVDFVRDERDGFALMELELIEPALYFRMDNESPKRFAMTFDSWMNGRKSQERQRNFD